LGEIDLVDAKLACVIYDIQEYQIRHAWDGVLERGSQLRSRVALFWRVPPFVTINLVDQTESIVNSIDFYFPVKTLNQ
jgi:hypothetical protein